MIKIKLSKQAHIYSPPKALLKRLRKDLQVFNPKWIDNQRMGRYNRDTPKYINIYEEGPGRISVPSGYIEEIQETLTHEEIPFDIYDLRVERSAAFNFKGELRGFQGPACRRILMFDTGTLEAPTGSGKTVMGLYIIAARRQKTLVIVHTKDLAFQWIERAAEFLDIRPEEIGLIGAGKKSIGRRLTIGLIQSVTGRVDELGKVFGQVVVDEAHRTPSKTFTNAVDGLFCKYSLGLSATPYRRDNLTKLIFWYLGPNRFTVSKQRLYDEGHIMEPLFIIRSTSFEPVCDPVSEYPAMLSELTEDEERNELICGDIVDQAENTKNNCLILSDRKAHCRKIRDMLAERGTKALVLTGETKADQRKKILSQIGNGHRFLIATGQLVGEGFDCKALNVMFLTTPIRFTGRVLQYIGRVMRPADGKDRPLVYDYADWNVKPLRKATHSRIRIYKKKNVTHE